jgi:pimeloyl-ACP methyl ester carboxylesterase
MAVSAVTEEKVDVGGCALHVLRGGTGSPALVLHHSSGPLGWLPFHERLGSSYAVAAADLPGYGQSERPEWAREPRDLAIVLGQMLDQAGLDDVTLVGFGLGGFVAAEMATMAQRRLKRLVLVGAAGIKPREGDIADQMMSSFANYARNGFRDAASFGDHLGEPPSQELRDLWTHSREMTARITWKPYMFNLRLPHALAGVRTPALIVWGRHDKIVPLDCGHQYAAALPNSRLEVVEDAGHFVELEQPEQLATLIEGA